MWLERLEQVKELIEKLRRASEKTGEKIWELPLYDEFHEQIKSTIADIKNIGGRPEVL